MQPYVSWHVVQLPASSHITLHICHPRSRPHALPLMCGRVHAPWSGSLTFIATRWCRADMLASRHIHYSINILHMQSYESTALLWLSFVAVRCWLSGEINSACQWSPVPMKDVWSRLYFMGLFKYFVLFLFLFFKQKSPYLVDYYPCCSSSGPSPTWGPLLHVVCLSLTSPVHLWL